MKTGNSIGPLPGWTARWPRLPVVVIGAIALCVVSCKSQSPTTTRSHHTSDTLQSLHQSALTLMPVPPSQVQTKLSLSQLSALPLGAGYSRRSGQATSRIIRGGDDTLIFTSGCDSLQRQVYALRQELTRIRSDTTLHAEEQPAKLVNQPTGWQWFWIYTGRISAGLLLLAAGFKLYTKRSEKITS